METLNHFDFLRALGSSLVNSLWQFGIFWILFRFFLVPLKSFSAAVKHGVLILFLSLSTGWFVLDILKGYNFPTDTLIYSVTEAKSQTGIAIFWNQALVFFEQNLSLLSTVYLLVVLVLFANFSRYFIYARRVQTRGLMKPAVDLRLQVARLASGLSITRRVDVWLSELIDTPMIIGFLKPTILLPLASVNQLSMLQMEAILLHELAHIRRNDYLINIYISSLKILFFFNPFCRMLIEAVRQEREKSCDDWVLQFRFDPHQYASALFQLEAGRTAGFSLGIAAGGAGKKFLLERIERILKVKSSGSQGRFNFAGYLSALLIMGFVLAFAPAKFEVEKMEKSIKIQLKETALAFVDKKYFVPANSNAIATDEESVKGGADPYEVIPDDAKNIKEDESDKPVYDVNDDLSASSEIIHVNNVEAVEERSFSINAPEIPDQPVVDEERPAPFVPKSSFSFLVVEDTTRPKIKEETFAERSAKESLVKAKKALAQVDWEKLQKELAKKGKLSKDMLLKYLENSLDALNWEEINKDVAEALNQQSLDKWRASLKSEIDDAKKYKELQSQYQALKLQLQEAQKNLKKEVEVQQLEVAKEIKKSKAVIHL